MVLNHKNSVLTEIKDNVHILPATAMMASANRAPFVIILAIILSQQSAEDTHVGMTETSNL